MARAAAEPVPKLTADELAFAMGSGGAVYEGKMQSPPISEVTRPIEIAGETVTLTDVPLNRAALGILESLKHDPLKARAALYRIMLIGFDVLRDPRAADWTRKADDGKLEIQEPLIEAIATVPANFYRKVNLDRVFRLAAKIAKASGK